MTEVSCQLIRFLKTKSFLGNSKNGERNLVNEQRTHKHRERQRERGENLLVNVQMSMYLLRFTLYFKSIYNAF